MTTGSRGFKSRLRLHMKTLQLPFSASVTIAVRSGHFHHGPNSGTSQYTCLITRQPFFRRSHRRQKRQRRAPRQSDLQAPARRSAVSRHCRDIEDTVVPQVVNAILSRHNFILLGLRGQAKTRLIRMLTTLLDRGHALRRGLRDSRQPVPPDLPPLPRSDRGAGRRNAHRLAHAATIATWKNWPRRMSPSPT